MCIFYLLTIQTIITFSNDYIIFMNLKLNNQSSEVVGIIKPGQRVQLKGHRQ